MVQNFPGPFEVEIEYDVAGLTHRQRLNCAVASPLPAPGTPPNAIDLIKRNGTNVALDAAVLAWVNLLAPRFETLVSTFVGYTFWEYEPLSTVKKFITADTLGVDGSSTLPASFAQQETFTFKTAEGNDMRIVLLETISVDDNQVPIPASGPSTAAIGSFIDSDVNWILGRDTSYPIAQRLLSKGENEAVWRKRFR